MQINTLKILLNTILAFLLLAVLTMIIFGLDHYFLIDYKILKIKDFFIIFFLIIYLFIYAYFFAILGCYIYLKHYLIINNIYLKLYLTINNIYLKLYLRVNSNILLYIIISFIIIYIYLYISFKLGYMDAFALDPEVHVLKERFELRELEFYGKKAQLAQDAEDLKKFWQGFTRSTDFSISGHKHITTNIRETVAKPMSQELINSSFNRAYFLKKELIKDADVLLKKLNDLENLHKQIHELENTNYSNTNYRALEIDIYRYKSIRLTSLSSERNIVS